MSTVDGGVGDDRPSPSYGSEIEAGPAEGQNGDQNRCVDKNCNQSLIVLLLPLAIPEEDDDQS